MDGYAVAPSRRRRPRPPSRRCTCRWSARSAPARPACCALAPGTAAKIMTGAPIPAGADAVVPYEWTDRGVAQVRIDQAPEPGQHVRPAGEDVAVGDLLVSRGHRARPAPHRPARRRSAGRRVRSRPRPRVVVISTGSELRDPGTDARPRLDLRRQLLPARRRRAPRRRDRLPGRHRPRRAAARSSTRCTTSWCAPTSWSPAAASPRATTTSSRRRCAARHASGSARSRCSRASRRASASSATTGPRSSRCRATRSRRTSPSSMFVLPAIRKLMGLTPYARPPVDGPAHPRRSPRRRAAAQFVRGQVRRRRRRAGTSTPVGGHGSHLIGDLARPTR